MLLNSVNPIDYVLDIAYGKKEKENENETDQNTYKNLNQEEEDETINNSNTLKFNDSEKDSPLFNVYNKRNSNIDEHNQFFEPRTKSKLFNYIIDKIFLYSTRFLKLIGPLFCLSIITFLLYTYFSILKNIFPFWYKNFFPYENHKIFYNLYKFLLSIELFLTIFNNLLAIIVKPGNVSDIKKSKYYRRHNPYYSEKLQFHYFIKNNHINNNNNNINWRICKYCKEIKPLRTHHCSLCGTCILKMDHHCPWINNCIGQNNHRYFLLFLFHVFCYSFLGTMITFPIILFKNKIMEKNLNIIVTKNNFNMREVKYITALGISSLVIEFFFSGWNWFLAIKGNTTLEFWAEKTDYNLNGGIKDYSFGDWRKNLFYIFGTDDLYKILFIPNIKKLPFSGLEMSKLVDKNFNI